MGIFAYILKKKIPDLEKFWGAPPPPPGPPRTPVQLGLSDHNALTAQAPALSFELCPIQSFLASRIKFF